MHPEHQHPSDHAYTARITSDDARHQDDTSDLAVFVQPKELIVLVITAIPRDDRGMHTIARNRAVNGPEIVTTGKNVESFAKSAAANSPSDRGRFLFAGESFFDPAAPFRVRFHLPTWHE